MNGKIIEAKELRCKKRHALHDIIPLAAPFVIYIDPANVCNFRCIFCPTGDNDLLRAVHRPKGLMPFELFQKVVSDIKFFGEKLKLINLYKDGEPLLNPHFPEMVGLIKDANIAEKVWTKTNASFLNKDLNRKIVDSGLDLICISIEATSAEGYKAIAGVSIDFQEMRKNIEDFYLNRGKCEVYIKIVDVNLTSEEKETFYKNFQSISTHIGIEKLMGWSNSGMKDFTLGTNPDTYDGLPFTEKDVCPYPFYVMAVNSDGSVSLCGNDWSHQTVVGDVRKQSLTEIWNSEALYTFRMMLLEGQRHKNKACGDCYYLKIVPDNLDAHSDLITKNLRLHKKNDF